jgi:hypothetical protein
VFSIVAAWSLGDGMDERSELQALAAKCRQLALALTDENARTSLLDLADEYERRALAQSQIMHPNARGRHSLR